MTGPGSLRKGLMGDRTGPGSFLKVLMGDRTGPVFFFLKNYPGPVRSTDRTVPVVSSMLNDTQVPRFLQFYLKETYDFFGGIDV